MDTDPLNGSINQIRNIPLLFSNAAMRDVSGEISLQLQELNDLNRCHLVHLETSQIAVAVSALLEVVVVTGELGLVLRHVPRLVGLCETVLFAGEGKAATSWEGAKSASRKRVEDKDGRVSLLGTAATIGGTESAVGYTHLIINVIPSNACASEVDLMARSLGPIADVSYSTVEISAGGEGQVLMARNVNAFQSVARRVGWYGAGRGLDCVADRCGREVAEVD